MADLNRFNKIHPTLQVPVNAALLTGTVVAVLGCIYVGNISFTFPIGLLIFGRRKHMKPTTFPLGNVWGPIINIVAFGYIVFIVIMFCFPFTYPVAADNMSMFPLVGTAVRREKTDT
jgi:choline transport protein